MTDDRELDTAVSCEIAFSEGPYTTTILFDHCPDEETLTTPPGWPAKPYEACTIYNGYQYCADGNCEYNSTDYYGLAYWWTTCSTDGCTFKTEGPSIGYDCATTSTLKNGCLKIERKDWDVTSTTISCPAPTECNTTVYEFQNTPHTLTTCPPNVDVPENCTMEETTIGTKTFTALDCLVEVPPIIVDPQLFVN